MENIESVLNADPLAEIEKQTNKHWSEFNESEKIVALLSAMGHNKNKNAILSAENDTRFSISWNEFCEIMKLEGFLIGYEEVYEYNNFGKPCDEKIIAFYNPDRYMIAWAQSYSNITSVNSILIHAHIKNYPEGVPYSGGFDKKQESYKIHFDGREGLRHNLSKLDSYICVSGDFEDSFLWFNKLSECKCDDYDYKAISKSYIEKCSREFMDVFYGIQ